METVLIFPHQLFENNPLVKPGVKIFIIEEYLFFKQYAFHKQKLVFHRASMKFYQKYLSDKGFDVQYIESEQAESDIRKFFKFHPSTSITIIDPVDNYLLRRIKTLSKQLTIELKILDNPSFLNTRSDLNAFFQSEKKQFSQTSFYIQQRKKAEILLDTSGKPTGGKWTFDAENRKKYPLKKTPPQVHYPPANPFYTEAYAYVNKHFPENPGEISPQPLYPFGFEEAKKWLQQFLEYRFYGFGDYEDAIVSGQSYLHHSLLSPLLNAGLLTPDYVLAEILDYAEKQNIGLNNAEGLIRQIIGWREFIRGIYKVKGSEERTRNFWNFNRKMPDGFYTGTTGIEPVDITIKKLLKTGYSHHIERLMVLGNFMLLCEIDPDEVYRWFMEMYVDAYDWVMVPNVYGMSQFADGGIMSTKPYISGSNYLTKMSDFQKGTWQEVWDGLFWRFMDKHRDFFLSNPRLGMLIRTFDRMDEKKKEKHLQTGENFLARLA